MKALAALLVAAFAVRSALVVVRVNGDSMRPAYADGDVLLGIRGWRVRQGRVVVFRTPDVMRHEGDPPYRVKRVAAVAGDLTPDWVPDLPTGARVPPDRLVVRGDTERSEDSRHYGYVDRQDVLAVVFGRLSGSARS